MEFTSEVTVRLYDTDPTGVLFFGSLFRFTHAAIEDFLQHLDFPVARLISDRESLFPVVHVEADYRAPVTVGERLTVRLSVREIGGRSFSIAYRLLLADGREAASAVTVHAALDPATGSSRPLPEAVRAALEPYVAAGA